METFNLVKETIIVNQVDFIQAMNTLQPFAITIDGEILDANEIPKRPIIYKGTPKRNSAASTSALPITKILGTAYKITIEGPKLLIQSSLAWQELLPHNLAIASYDDSTGDGISVFTDEALEDMGWHATDFDIEYRDMIDHLEQMVPGTLFCIEHDEPYRFSGLGFFEDEELTRNTLKAYLVNAIEEKLKSDPYFAADNLDDDQEKALAFFGITL